MKKKCLSLLLALVMCLSLLPATASAADEKYYSGEHDGMVWSFDRATGALTISGTGKMQGNPPWIYEDWNKEIVSVVIQNGITGIGDGMFKGCTALTSVTIPGSVDRIGERAFQGCVSLTSVNIPDGVTSIGSYAFDGCAALTSVTIPKSVTKIGSLAFRGCGSLTSVVIPSGVTEIEARVFEGCTGLTSVTIPNSVTSIWNGAFQYCSSLTSVNIPDNVTVLGAGAFGSCSSLTSITIPSGVTKIEDGTFGSCSGLTSIVIPSGVTEIGTAAFRNCTSLTSVTIPASVTKIGSSAFWGCNGLASVTIENGNVKIGESAFWVCEKLFDIYFRGTLAQLELACRGLEARPFLKQTTVHCSDGDSCEVIPVRVSFNSYGGSEVPDKELFVGKPYGELPTPTREGYSFDGWFFSGNLVTSSTMVTISKDHVLYAEWTEVKMEFVIEDNVLKRYNGPGGDVVVPEGVTKIGGLLFQGNTTITSLTIGDNVTIGNSAISKCAALTDVTIGNNAVISSAAFWSCPVLTNMTIGDNASISDNAMNCESLTSLTLGKNAAIGEKAFTSCTSLTGIVLPEGVTLEKQAFYKCTALTNVTLPQKGHIGDSAFYKCTNLKSLTVPAGVECSKYAFYNSSLEVIYGVEGSSAQAAAKQAGIKFAAVGAGATDPTKVFTDLSPTGFYLDAVAWAVEKNITTGTTATTFSPKDNCTHGQILTFLWRAAGSPASNVTLPFATTGKEYYLGAAKWAYEKGMIDKNFNHKTPCTRADAVNYIWQAFGKKSASYDGRFTDVPKNSPYATAVAWALTNGVTTGTTTTTFTPDKICNRGEIVTFLHRAYSK